jgi:hypothetical protein
MAKDTTPAEAKAIHLYAALTAQDIASKWIRSEVYRNSTNRFRMSIAAALDVVNAGVSPAALEVNQYLAATWPEFNSMSSQYSRLASEIEAEILGYALEAQDAETLQLFNDVLNMAAA